MNISIPQHCPFCGSEEIEGADGGFIEIGEWDGKSYEEEFDLNGWVCECGQRFWTTA